MSQDQNTNPFDPISVTVKHVSQTKSRTVSPRNPSGRSRGTQIYDCALRIRVH